MPTYPCVTGGAIPVPAYDGRLPETVADCLVLDPDMAFTSYGARRRIDHRIAGAEFRWSGA
jgi:hypothetical protein